MLMSFLFKSSNGHGYSTDFSSKSDYSDGGGGHSVPQGGGEATPGGTLPTPGGASSSDGGHGGHHGAVSGSCTEGSLGHESGYSGDGGAYIGNPFNGWLTFLFLQFLGTLKNISEAAILFIKLKTQLLNP